MSVPGWSGAGYVILDPVVGDGEWKISGGDNGGRLKTTLNKGLFWIGAAINLYKSNPLAGGLMDAALAGVLNVLSTAQNLIELLRSCESVNFAVAVTAIIFVVSVVMEAVLIVSGVGIVGSLVISGLVSLLENAVVDWTKNHDLCES